MESERRVKKIEPMELEKILHMKGGNEETSYAQVAYVAKRVIEMTKPIREKAIAQLFNQELLLTQSTLCIADLGCASGPNTLSVVSELIITNEKVRQRLNIHGELEYQVFLNDLPGNDFNSVFMSLSWFYQKLKEEVGLRFGQCYVAGVPGSFYGRLFPRRSLHFVHSSYSLYWLSQVPEGLEGNKLNIHISSTSPPRVLKAYKEQFQRDTALFLSSRSEELVKGGQMVLTYWGRAIDDPNPLDCFCIWDLLSIVLNQLVSEGILEEEKVEAFNIPVYHPSATEVTSEIEKEGSFLINSVDVSQVNYDTQENGMSVMNKESTDKVAKRGDPPSRLLRCIVESLLARNFGTAVIDEIFERYSKLIEDVMNRQTVLLTNVTISVTKT